MRAKGGLACLLLLMLVCWLVEASHFAYGTYYWSKVPGYSNRFKFTMESAWRLNYGWGMTPSKGPPPNAPNTGVDVMISYGSGGSCTNTNCGSAIKKWRVAVTVSEVYSSANWFSGLFEWTHDISDMNRKHFLHYRICCRLSTLMDGNKDRYTSLIATMDPREDTSPRTTGMPREYFERNQPISYRIPGVSPQGYKLTYAKSTTALTDLAKPTPSSTYGKFDLDTVTGQVTWTPNTVGLFAVAFTVSDGKSVVPLDMIFEVLTSCGSNPNCNRPPTVTTVPAATKVTFYRGVQKKVTVQSTDPDTSDTTIVLNTQLPAGATFNLVSRSGPTSTYEFSWVPPLDATSWDVCYKAQDSRGAYSLGNYCVTKEIGVASIIYVSGIIRNFPLTGATDFGKTSDGDNGAALVKTNLPGTAKPELASPPQGKTKWDTVDSATSFNRWWNKASDNQEMVYSLTLSNGTRTDGRIFTFSSDEFWPVNGELYGAGKTSNNPYFTYEIHTYLTYKGGEKFEYKSSDDLWVFIDNRLPPSWTLAGVHGSKTQTIDMDSLASQWGLRKGETYRVDIFYAHRHATRKPVLQLELPEAVLCNALQSGVVAQPDVGNNGFTTSTPIVMSGKARIQGGHLQPVYTGQYNNGGAAWLGENVGGTVVAKPHKVLHGFEVIFTFQVTDITSAAEGFAFVLQAESPNARGSEGPSLGYGSITRSLAIEFDMSQDSSLGDPAFQHVSIHYRKDAPETGANDASETYSIGRSNNDPQLQMTNGTVHRVRIEYQPAREEASSPDAPLYGWIRVYMNQVLKPIVEAPIDGRHLNRMFPGGAAYVGFTAANGETRSATYKITSFKMTLVPASAAETSLTSAPPMVRAGQTGSVVIQMRDACANNIRVGGEASKFAVTIERRAGETPSGSTYSITDNNDGTYTLQYNVPFTGLMNMDIRFNGQRIKNSPYTFQVVSGPTDPARSDWVYSYPPLSVAPDNCPREHGLCVVVLDGSTGKFVDRKVFDAVNQNPASGYDNPAQLKAFIDSVATGHVIVVVVDTSMDRNRVPSDGINALNGFGCTINGVENGDSFVCIGVKGTATIASTCSVDRDGVILNSQSCRQHRPTWTTGLVKRAFNSFTVWAQSWGSKFGSGAYVYSVPKNYEANAGIESTFTIISRDSYGQISNDADDWIVSFSPSISGEAVVSPQVHAGYYDVTWLAERATTYQLYNKLNNVLIGTTNAPAPVTVHAGRAVASRSSAFVSGAAIAGTQPSFELRLYDAFGNAIVMDSGLDSYSASLVKMDQPNTTVTTTFAWEGGVLKGKFTAQKAGTYELRVTVNGEQLPEVAEVLVNPGAASASKTTASGRGVGQEGAISAGEVVTFYIQPCDQYENVITTTISPEPAVSIQGQYRLLTITHDGTRYVVTYIAQRTGSYTVSVKLGGTEIQDSPFSVNVVFGAAAATSTLENLPDEVTAGQEITGSIKSLDGEGNERTGAGDGKEYSVVATNLQTLEPENGNVQPKTSGAYYNVKLVLNKAGSWSIAASLSSGGEAITGSPKNIVVKPADPHAANCVFSGNGLYGGEEETTATINIQLRDIFANDRLGTSDELEFYLKGTKTGDIIAEGNGRYRIEYQVPKRTVTVGPEQFNYLIKVKLSSGEWMDLYQQDNALSFPSSDASYALISGSKTDDRAPIPVIVSGTPAHIYIHDRDGDGHERTSTDTFSATIKNSNGVVISGVNVAPVYSGNQQLGDPTSIFEILFTPQGYAGQWQLHVYWNGYKEIMNSPVTITIVPGEVSPAQSIIHGLPKTVTAGDHDEFYAELRDQFSQTIPEGIHNVTATFTTSTNSFTVQGVWDNSLKRYRFEYVIEQADTWTVAVREANRPTQYISGGTRQLKITPAEPSANKTIASGPGLTSATAGEVAYFDVEIRDMFLNRVIDSALGDDLTCELKHEEGSTNCGPAQERPDGKWRLTYTTNHSRPAALGCYTLDIRFRDQAISGSPACVEVQPAAISPVHSQALDQDPTIAGQQLKFKLHLKDVQNNEWRIGAERNVRVSAITPSGDRAAASVRGLSVNESIYEVTLSGTETRVAGTYQWEITVSSSPFVPSNLQTQQVLPGPVDPTQSAVIRSPVNVVVDQKQPGNGVQLLVRDQYGNPVTGKNFRVTVTFLEGHILSCSEMSQNETMMLPVVSDFLDVTNSTNTSSAIISINFKTQRIGKYTLELAIDDLLLPCDTMRKDLRFAVSEDVLSVPHSAFDVRYASVQAGASQAVIVYMRDRFFNPALKSSIDISKLAVQLTPEPTFMEVGNWTERAILGASVYETSLVLTKAQQYTLTVTYDGEEITGINSTFTVVPGPAQSAVWPPRSTFENKLFAGQPLTFTLQTADLYGNPVTEDTSFSFDVKFTGDLTVLNTTYKHNPKVTASGGVHNVTLLPYWVGEEFELTIMLKLDGVIVDSITYDKLVVLPATCAALDPSNPKRCPDGSCAAEYEQCPGVQMCSDPNKPNRCATDPSICVANVRDCPCPPNQEHCPTTGQCVEDPSSNCLQAQPCPAGTQPCYEEDAAGNKFFTGQCRANNATDCPSRVVCTPGYVLCPNGVECARDLESCSTQGYEGCPKGYFRCPTGQCVESLNDCPTPKTCTNGEVLCASDGSCRDSAEECPQQFDCFEPTPFRCPDGSCRANAAQCPTSVVCPVGWVLCESGLCAKSRSECLQPIMCDASEVRCPDGSCQPHLLFCATVQSCPVEKPVLCADGSCKESVSLCSSPRTCPAGTKVCGDGTCVEDIEDCPTGKTCPPEAPLLCPNKDCVSDLEECGELHSCPMSAPIRCPDGSCRAQLIDCPSQTSCPASMPYKCPDGRCAIAIDDCAEYANVKCPKDMKRCPGGECVKTVASCPTHVTCPIGSKRCIDGTCRKSCPDTITVRECPAGEVVCPQAGAGVVCADRLELCPLAPVCPADKPVKCIDSSCAATVTDCPPVPEDTPTNMVPCPDGTWKSDATQCATLNTCPPNTVKCFDETCRKYLEDCPVPPVCPRETPYLCPNSKCVDRPWDPQCMSAAEVCDAGTPIRCPLTGECIPKDAWDTMCVGKTQDELLVETPCPEGLTVRCRDGTCVQSAAQCASKQCPFHLPYLCPDGLCVKEARYCNLDNGCPWNKPVRCPSSGACAADLRQCPRGEEKCPGDEVECADGSCAASPRDCPSENGCRPGYIRCLDGTCAPSPAPGTPPEQTMCNTGNPTEDFNKCPSWRPYLCDNGYCALSATLCPELDFPCPNDRPVQCAVGTCVANSVQCPVLQPVRPEEIDPALSTPDNPPLYERCMDGTYRERGRCPRYSTCPPGYKHRCPSDGLCVVSLDDCLNEKGCPKSRPHLCFNTTGVCVEKETDCTAYTINPNGCPNSYYKCWDGTCAAEKKLCPLYNGCPRERPFRCTYQGICTNSTASCPTEPGCPEGYVTCADDSCAEHPSKCHASNGCPVTTPVRCGDGSCAKSGADCPAVVICNEGESLCYDGKCVADPATCKPRVPCPIETPYRCGDGSCVPSPQNCTVCPATAPVRCPNGVCRAKLGDCESISVQPLPNDESPCTDPDKPVLCFDGSCRRSFSDCVDWQKAIAGEDEETAICPQGQVLCPNGACGFAKECIVPRCPPERPLRCWDGTCISPENGRTCPEETVKCPTGKRRCEDGSCRAQCLQYDGCGLDAPYHCANRECARTSDDCVAAELFDESLAIGKPIVTAQSIGRKLMEDRSGPHRPDYNADEPHVCYENCKAMLKSMSLAVAVDPRRSTEVTVVVDSNRLVQAKIVIPSGAMMSRSNASGAQPILYVRPVGESRMRTMVNRVTQSRRGEFGKFMTMAQTLLSPAFELSVSPDTVVPFEVPITVAAQIDLDKQPLYKDVCLAYEYTVPDLDFRAWRCLTAADRLGNPVRTVETNRTEPRQWVKGNIYQPEGLIYAFVHAPLRASDYYEDNSDWWADNLIWIVLGLCGAGVVVGGVFYVMHRLYRYRRKYKETGKQVKEMEAEVDEMEQFGGQAGTKDESVEMVANPLLVQMRDLQARLDRKNKEVLEEEARIREMQSEARREHIAALVADRDRMLAELEELRRQLAESQPTLTAVVPEPATTAQPSRTKKPVRANFDAQPAQRRKKQVD